MRCHNVQGFQFWIRFVRMFQEKERNYNLYYSMAEFKDGVPFRNTKGGNLKEDFTEWNARCRKEITSYDMLIDIDAGNFDEVDYALETTVSLKKMFDSFAVPYYLRFSGMGFHFVIPYGFFSHLGLSFDPNHDANIYSYMRSISKGLNEVYSEMIDYTIYDSRRISKLPYSLSIYADRVMVCSPVDNPSTFRLDDYRLENFINPREYVEVLHNPKGSISNLETVRI